MLWNLWLHFYWVLPIVFGICPEECVKDILSLYEDLKSDASSPPYEEFKSDLTKDPLLYGNYDYVIVGAGTSGSVLANKLSEDGLSKVLILEAGKEQPSARTEIPGTVGLVQCTNYNYNFSSTPQKKACLGNREHKCAIPRGKGVGGSTLLNYAIYARGGKTYYDDLCCEYRDTDWCYDNVLNIYKKMENATMTSMIDKDYHGRSGPLPVQHPDYFCSGEKFLNATKEIGGNVCDYNGIRQDCSSKTQLTIKNGKKQTAYHIYLKNIRDRSNLKILANAFVTKIHITQDQATGVHFVRNGIKYVATAKKEYVLCAGAVGTPQILMLSGIGPTGHLKSLNIPVKLDLPVGRNLWDHPFFFMTYNSDCCMYKNCSCSKIPKSLKDLCEEYSKGKGPLTVPGNIQSIGFFNTDKDADKEQPNIELLTLYNFSLLDGFLKKAFYLSIEFMTEFLKDQSEPSNLLVAALQTPQSRGNITLKTDNPFDAPLINLNFYDNEKDLEAMVKAIHLIRDLINTSTMQKCQAKLIIPKLSACKNWKQDSTEYLQCYIQHTTNSLYHLAGTCKMGPKCSRDTVVTPDCKVKNIQKLRVADVSTLSQPIAAHTTTVGYLIGTVCSSKIKADHPK